jgi:hypothetical protein
VLASGASACYGKYLQPLGARGTLTVCSSLEQLRSICICSTARSYACTQSCKHLPATTATTAACEHVSVWLRVQNFLSEGTRCRKHCLAAQLQPRLYVLRTKAVCYELARVLCTSSYMNICGLSCLFSHLIENTCMFCQLHNRCRRHTSLCTSKPSSLCKLHCKPMYAQWRLISLRWEL